LEKTSPWHHLTRTNSMLIDQLTISWSIFYSIFTILDDIDQVDSIDAVVICRDLSWCLPCRCCYSCPLYTIESHLSRTEGTSGIGGSDFDRAMCKCALEKLLQSAAACIYHAYSRWIHFEIQCVAILLSICVFSFFSPLPWSESCIFEMSEDVWSIVEILEIPLEILDVDGRGLCCLVKSSCLWALPWEVLLPVPHHLSDPTGWAQRFVLVPRIELSSLVFSRCYIVLPM